MQQPKTTMGQLPYDKKNRLDAFTQQKTQLCCYLFRPDNKEIIPLSSLEYKVDVQLGVAVIEMTQTYNNTLEKPTDLEYLFSLPSNAAFTKLKVRFGDKLLVGQIKEMEETNNVFEYGVEDDKTTVQSVQDNSFPDVIRVKLGSLAPGSILKVLFQYIQPLEVCVNEFWKLKISSIVNPLYCLPQSGRLGQYIMNVVNLETQQNNYKQYITVNINLPTALTFCKSPTHEILNLAVKGNQRQIKLNPNIRSNYSLDKPFVLLFANKKIHEPQAILTRVNNNALAHQKYCVTISCIPKFNPLTLDKAYQAYLNESDLDTQEFKYQQLGEYIFIIDRSGSMSGERIAKAKEALELFLKSLPSDSYFNVYSFGSDFSKLWDEPQKYSQATLNQALQEVSGMDADMGGTQMLSSFENIYQQIRQQGYPRNLFLLTDGQDGQPDLVLEAVKANCAPGIKVYTLGIGSGCSRFLIEKVASAGNGKCHFIEDDDEDLNAKVIDLLQDSITPYLEQFQLDTTIQNIYCIVPNPQQLVCLKKNNPCTIQVLFGEQGQDIKQIQLGVSYYDPQTKQSLQYNIALNLVDFREEPSFHKLAALQQIQAIEEAFKLQEMQLTKIDMRKDTMEYEDLVSLSVINQVICSVTTLTYEEEEFNEDQNEEFNEEPNEEPNEEDNEEPNEEVNEEPNEEDNEEPNEEDNEEPNEEDNEEPNEEDNEEPNEEDNEEPHEKENEEINEKDNEEPHEKENEEPHEKENEEINEKDNEEPHEKENEEINEKDNEEHNEEDNEEDNEKHNDQLNQEQKTDNEKLNDQLNQMNQEQKTDQQNQEQKTDNEQLNDQLNQMNQEQKTDQQNQEQKTDNEQLNDQLNQMNQEQKTDQQNQEQNTDNGKLNEQLNQMNQEQKTDQQNQEQNTDNGKLNEQLNQMNQEQKTDQQNQEQKTDNGKLNDQLNQMNQEQKTDQQNQEQKTINGKLNDQLNQMNQEQKTDQQNQEQKTINGKLNDQLNQMNQEQKTDQQNQEQKTDNGKLNDQLNQMNQEQKTDQQNQEQKTDNGKLNDQLNQMNQEQKTDQQNQEQKTINGKLNDQLNQMNQEQKTDQQNQEQKTDNGKLNDQLNQMNQEQKTDQQNQEQKTDNEKPNDQFNQKNQKKQITDQQNHEQKTGNEKPNGQFNQKNQKKQKTDQQNHEQKTDNEKPNDQFNQKNQEQKTDKQNQEQKTDNEKPNDQFNQKNQKKQKTDQQNHEQKTGNEKPNGQFNQKNQKKQKTDQQNHEQKTGNEKPNGQFKQKTDKQNQGQKTGKIQAKETQTKKIQVVLATPTDFNANDYRNLIQTLKKGQELTDIVKVKPDVPDIVEDEPELEINNILKSQPEDSCQPGPEKPQPYQKMEPVTPPTSRSSKKSWESISDIPEKDTCADSSPSPLISLLLQLQPQLLKGNNINVLLIIIFNSFIIGTIGFNFYIGFLKLLLFLLFTSFVVLFGWECKTNKSSKINQPIEPIVVVLIKSYLDITKFAQADGSFDIQLGNSFSVNPDNYTGNVKLEYWICILALCYLELKFNQDRGAWKMIFTKCKRYLQDNQIEYEDHKDQVTLAFHI